MFEIGEESEPWFPRLTPNLVNAVAKKLLRPIGLSTENYSSNSYLENSANRPIDLFHQFLINGTNGPNIEFLAEHHKQQYQSLGLKFLPDHKHNENVVLVIHDALSALSEIPSLKTSISYLVKSIHVLAVTDDSFDVSHSDPKLPLSIFLSVPSPKTPFSALRVAEALVHEAMHLQLSIIDLFNPLLLGNKKSSYSPWMGEFRPLLGVLHGMYVFSNILRALELLVTKSRNSRPEHEYLINRIAVIEGELLAAQLHFDQKYLTHFGRIIFAIA